ncbi:cell envelope integrity protein TolA [Ideonella sp.]|jgi:colicin import membrane protein|uniref:cell envelope integrity protein TolA n=1 Tax=Ideonella sp. TaxID=1929293 RepID=UPI0037BFF7C8
MHQALRHSTIPLDALHPPKADGVTAGVALSILVHMGLITALTLGVQWRSQSDEGVEAELWASVPQLAAPPAQAPPPAQEPAEVAPPPPPPIKVSPPPPPQAAQPDAEIALEQAKKAKLEKQRQADAEKRAEAKKQAEQDKLDKAKEDKARKDKAEKEQAAKDKAEQERKEKLAAREKAKAEAAEAAEEAAREKARQAHLQRMKDQLSGNGGPQSTGTAPVSAGPSAGYAGRIKARIRPNIRLLDPVSGNPEATVEVKVTPDGTIIGRRLIKPSGDKAWDEAVLRAIDRTERLPRDTDGSIPPVFEIKFNPRD